MSKGSPTPLETLSDWPKKCRACANARFRKVPFGFSCRAGQPALEPAASANRARGTPWTLRSSISPTRSSICKISWMQHQSSRRARFNDSDSVSARNHCSMHLFCRLTVREGEEKRGGDEKRSAHFSSSANVMYWLLSTSYAARMSVSSTCAFLSSLDAKKHFRAPNCRPWKNAEELHQA